MLKPLQEQVAQIIAGLEEAEEFALAGGAALIARGDVQRETRDLDFFGLTADAVDRLVPAVDRALREAGLTVHHVQVNPGFARLIVESADDRTELDLAADARLFPAEPGRPAPMLSGEELAVDKLLALFGRAEARDFIDLMEVEPRSGLDRLCRLAAEKDRGFTPAVLAEMLARFSRLRREEFDLDMSATSSLAATSSAGASERWSSPFIGRSSATAGAISDWSAESHPDRPRPGVPGLTACARRVPRLCTLAVA